MAIYCGNCAKRNEWPRSAVRTSRDPCDFCGGFDEGLNTNYSYPDALFPGSKNEINAQLEREEQQAKGEG